MRLKRGQKVVYKNAIYDFGYHSQTLDRCIIYIEGEQNMQDSYSVLIANIKIATLSDLSSLRKGF